MREELIKKTEQLCELYKELNAEGVYGNTYFLGEVRIQCENHTLVKLTGNNPTKTRELPSEEYPTETSVKLDKFTAFTLNEVAQNDEG